VHILTDGERGTAQIVLEEAVWGASGYSISLIAAVLFTTDRSK